MIEGSIHDFKVKTFWPSFSMPKNEATIDNILKQLLTRKKGVESFSPQTTPAWLEKNHYAEVPEGDSSSSQCQLSKCVKSMIKSGGDELKRDKRVLKSISM